jgi:uncharacterized membrane protein
MSNQPGRAIGRDQRGAVGTLIVVWIVITAFIGIAVIDTSSIFLTRFHLSDVASTAATQAANAYHGNRSIQSACQAAVQSITADDPQAQLAKKDGCVVNPTTGQVTITVHKAAKTILAGRLSFTKHYAKVVSTETNGPSTL